MSQINVTRGGTYVQESAATVDVTRGGAYVQQVNPHVYVTRGGVYVQQRLITEAVMQISDGTTTYDLLTGVLKVRYQGWEQQGPPPEGETTLQGYGASFKFTGYQPITETYELIAAAAATNLLIRQAVATIDKLLEQARRWHAQRSNYTSPVYLSFNTATEDERRSLIYGGSIVMLSGSGAQPSLTNNDALATLSITRHPLWMDASSTQILADTELTTAGGYSALLTQGGDAPAIIRMRLGCPLTQTNALTKVWFAVKDTSEMALNPSYYESALELILGTLQAGYGATEIADPAGDAVFTNIVQVDFSTGPHTELSERVSYSSSLSGMFRGVYRILLRAKVEAATSTLVGLQIRNGTAAGGAIACTEVTFSDTTWHWVDLGQVEVPIARLAPSPLTVLHIYAERFAGTGKLYLDTIVMMPAEHLVTLNNADIRSYGGGLAYAYIGAEDDDTLYCYQTDNLGLLASVPDMAANDFYFPCFPGGRVVVVAERATGHVSTDVINVKVDTIARWKHYRDT